LAKISPPFSPLNLFFIKSFLKLGTTIKWSLKSEISSSIPDEKVSLELFPD